MFKTSQGIIPILLLTSCLEVNSENVLNVLAHKNTHLENRKATSPYNIEQCREGYETLMCVPMYLYIAELGVTVGNSASNIIQIR